MKQSIIETPAGAIQMRLAGDGDLTMVMDIIADAAAWLEAKGIEQWPSPPNAYWWRRAAQFIIAQQIHLALLGDEAVGTIRLAWSDPYLWPEDPDNAGYIYGLAVRGDMHGQGLGAAILDWACMAIRSAGKPYARLDCQYHNSRLRQYYEEAGFVFRGQAVDRDYAAALYEKRLP